MKDPALTVETRSTTGKGLRLCLESGLLSFLAAGALFGDSGPAPTDLQQTAVIGHLNHAIQWHRQMQEGGRWIYQPVDDYYWGIQHNLANEAVQQAFAWAEAEALTIAEQSSGAGGRETATSEERRIATQSAAAATRARQIQAQINTLNRQIASSAGALRARLTAQENALEGELDLNRAVLDSFEKVENVLSGPEEERERGPATLMARINVVKRSVPEAFAPAQPASGSKPPPTTDPASGGLVQRVILIFSLARDRHDLSLLAAPSGPTAKLLAEADGLAAPLRQLRDRIIQQGRAATADMDTADTKALEAARRNLESLAAQYKQVAAALLALRQESIALGLSHENLREWWESFDRRSHTVVRSLIVRAASLLAALALLAVFSEIWRRATFRYVHDFRRRRQFLILRRFTIGVLMAIVVILGLASNFGSLATYAGLLTAGIAVALQSLILSIAGYFFVLGRYGIRAGDRITVSGVTGEVIEVGPVRFYLMELAATGVILHPTGRLIIFPNSVLFNTTPLYKQIPGTEYSWHEMAITLLPEADQAYVESKILEAVNTVYAEYRPSLEQQHNNVERLIDLRLELPLPTGQTLYAESGLSLVVRYPVALRQVAATDQAVSQRVQEAMLRDPKLRQAISGNPEIRAAVKT